MPASRHLSRPQFGDYIPADEPSAAHLLVQHHSQRAPGNRGHHSRGYGTPALDEPDASRKEHELPSQYLSEMMHA
jgi:hypothetical protein